MRYLQITFVLKKSGSPTEILYKDFFIQITLVLWVISIYVILYLRDVTFLTNEEADRQLGKLSGNGMPTKNHLLLPISCRNCFPGMSILFPGVMAVVMEMLPGQTTISTLKFDKILSFDKVPEVFSNARADSPWIRYWK